MTPPQGSTSALATVFGVNIAKDALQRFEEGTCANDTGDNDQLICDKDSIV